MSGKISFLEGEPLVSRKIFGRAGARPSSEGLKPSHSIDVDIGASGDAPSKKLPKEKFNEVCLGEIAEKFALRRR